MKCKEIIVAYPHEIKFIDKNGGTISYYVDRKVSDCVKELQDKLSEVESENTQKTIDKLRLQSKWNSLREWLENEESNSSYSISFRDSFRNVLSKMNELEGVDNEIRT